MNWFDISYTFLGGLGMFFFGMKTMSESLQALAGNLIRDVIKALTSNRFMAVMVGTLVTMIVQSSSVTTVMVVGFVNAGLMGLTQAIGVILGANIGTTITGWIIAIKVGKYGLLLVGVGAFPFMFAENPRWKNLGRLLVALGFIFMGLVYMGSAFKPLKETEQFISMLQYFHAKNVISILACAGVGAGLTLIIQSSSAMLGVTIALATTGAITFQTAAALVMGENVGTTITALLASIGTSSNAKRAARAHAIFNVLGVLVLIPFFHLYLGAVDTLISGNPDFIDIEGSKPLIAAHIAAAHTVFNLINVCVFIFLIPYLARFVTWLTPSPKEREVPHLQYLHTGVGKAPMIALTAAEKELNNLANIASKMMGLTKRHLLSKKGLTRTRKKIDHYEEVTDAIQTEITIFLCKTQQARLSYRESALCYAYIRAADELESIGDYCASLARYKDNMLRSDLLLTDAEYKELREFFEEVNSYFEEVITELAATNQNWQLEHLVQRSSGLTKMANNIRKNHRDRMKLKSANPIAGMLFSDMIVALRKLKGHVLNVAEAFSSDTATDES